MTFGVTILKPTASNPATSPELTDALKQSVTDKRVQVVALLQAASTEFTDITFANSYGAEDMVLTDIIAKDQLAIEIFSLDTGRLPAETYTLMGEVEKTYETKPIVFFPKHDAVEDYVRTKGINAFYESIELRKACCHMRKVEPLKRALTGKQAWVTGMRAEQAATRTSLPTREFDAGNQLEKFNPLSDWTEQEIWAYIRLFDVPYNALHDQFYPSIGCAPCTRAVAMGEDVRAGRWWWEDPNSKECGLHVKK
ncbi:MAG: phosphoadenylyl-sulfate reductase [Betaproteobacteria bacterium]|nr:phosphoadenylyl-sulfate reductase [Betaproteobacteria bacterium]MDG1454472.1 phosphoadenylyl-sulfate reductase [Methylophilaceae bacterium]